MKILALDTSTQSTTVGLMLDGREALEAYDHPGPGERPGHQARLLPLAADLLDQAGVGWRDVDRVVVGLGPGTYTGLRVGVASARALAQALELEIAGVSSTIALAHGAFRAGHTGPALTITDARRSELFLAAYAPAEDPSAAPLVLADPRPVPLAELTGALEELEASAEIALGPAWLAIGNGVVSASVALSQAEVRVPSADSPLHQLSAAALCELGARLPAQPLDAVTPDYRRPADAEIALAERERGRRHVPLAAGASG